MDLRCPPLPHQYARLHIYAASQIQASTPRQTTAIASLPIAYGAKSHITPNPDSLELLDASRKYRVQEMVGSLLYYTRTVNNKLLLALSAIAARQAKATVITEQAVGLLLDYVATYPNGSIVYHASDMIL